MEQYLNTGDKVVTFNRRNGLVCDVRVYTVEKATKTTATLDNNTQHKIVLKNCDAVLYGVPMAAFEMVQPCGVMCKAYLEKGLPDFNSRRFYAYSIELMAAIEKAQADFEAERQANLAIGQFIKSLNDKALKFTPELVLMLQDTIAKYNETAEKKF